MRMRGKLSSRATVQGDIYRSGGGSTISITPTYNSGTKIADYNIDGEEGAIYVPQQINITNLWNYIEDNNSNIYWTGSAITLNDDIRNYDEVVVEVISSEGDLYDNWKASYQWRLLVNPLINALEPYCFTICSYSQRSAKFRFTNTTLEKLMGNGSENGIINVYGVKY